jgi:hypothetical protein
LVYGLVPLIAGFVAYYWNYRKERRRISYEIFTYTELIDDKLKENGIKILYENDELSNLKLFIFRVVNDGFKPIRKDEFDTPISLLFEGKAQILSVELLKNVPDNLPVEYEKEYGSIDIKPLLLNRGDSFTFKLLVTNSSGGKPMPKVRISGIKNFTYYKKSALISFSDNLSILFGSVGCTFFIVAISVYLISGKEFPDDSPAKFWLWYGLGGIFISFLFFRLKKYLQNTSI